MTPAFPATTDLLRYLYADLRRVAEVGAEDIVLHTADRAGTGAPPVRGLDAVLAHETALITATDHTLVMDVTGICANEHFGAVLGTLRARHPEPVAMPFCGLWRFAGGRAVEHWENALDAPALASTLAGNAHSGSAHSGTGAPS